jgi:hypothetical protein
MVDVRPEDVQQAAKYTLFAATLSVLGITTVKISVCLFLLRIFHLAYRSVKWMIIINMTVLIPVKIATLIVNLVQCIPLSSYWDKSIEAQCMDLEIVNILLKFQSSELLPDIVVADLKTLLAYL